MKQVSKEEFFSAVGRFDLNPSKSSDRWSEEFGYRTSWKNKNREHIGLTTGSICTPVKKTYFLRKN